MHRRQFLSGLAAQCISGAALASSQPHGPELRAGALYRLGREARRHRESMRGSELKSCPAGRDYFGPTVFDLRGTAPSGAAQELIRLALSTDRAARAGTTRGKWARHDSARRTPEALPGEFELAALRRAARDHRENRRAGRTPAKRPIVGRLESRPPSSTARLPREETGRRATSI